MPDSLTRRRAVQGSLAATTAAILPSSLLAQAQVDELKILVGFPPGGTADVAARQLADKLAPSFARSAIVDNRPGAAGRIAIETLKTARPDGRTLLLTPASTVTIYPTVYKRLSYNPETDVEPVSLACTFVHGFAVGPMVPEAVKTLADFAAWAKANPDKANCGNPGEGSFPHFLSLVLARGLGVAIQPVAYRGGAPGLADMAAGQIAALLLPDGAFLPFTRTSRARVLATSGTTRSKFHPDVATFAEQGVKDIVVTEWFGVFAPPGSPAATVAATSEAIGKVLANPQVGEIFAQSGMVARATTPAELRAMMKVEADTWGPIIRSTGFQPLE
ncbi:MAG TPA: tripartite tricarboxylate transporter substrate-binding protein [Vineibacter sp.]|nr:tripartite tricarboxylate transporter substrate-binding protein [Vineibacter sp.]